MNTQQMIYMVQDFQLRYLAEEIKSCKVYIAGYVYKLKTIDRENLPDKTKSIQERVYETCLNDTIQEYKTLYKQFKQISTDIINL